MKEFFDIGIVLPVGVLLIQTLTLLGITLYFLRKVKLINLPFGGMEYSQAIFAAACLIALFIISTSAIGATFQAFETYSAQDIPIFKSLLGKSGQFLLVILVFETLLAILIFLTAKVLLGTTNLLEELNSGNIPTSIFISVIAIGFSIMLQPMSKEIIDMLTPHFLNFR